jgi:hypothetical protein
VALYRDLLKVVHETMVQASRVVEQLRTVKLGDVSQALLAMGIEHGINSRSRPARGESDRAPRARVRRLSAASRPTSLVDALPKWRAPRPRGRPRGALVLSSRTTKARVWDIFRADGPLCDGILRSFAQLQTDIRVAESAYLVGLRGLGAHRTTGERHSADVAELRSEASAAARRTGASTRTAVIERLELRVTARIGVSRTRAAPAKDRGVRAGVRVTGRAGVRRAARCCPRTDYNPGAYGYDYWDSPFYAHGRGWGRPGYYHGSVHGGHAGGGSRGGGGHGGHR